MLMEVFGCFRLVVWFAVVEAKVRTRLEGESETTSNGFPSLFSVVMVCTIGVGKAGRSERRDPTVRDTPLPVQFSESASFGTFFLLRETSNTVRIHPTGSNSNNRKQQNLSGELIATASK